MQPRRRFAIVAVTALAAAGAGAAIAATEDDRGKKAEDADPERRGRAARRRARRAAERALRSRARPDRQGGRGGPAQRGAGRGDQGAHAGVRPRARVPGRPAGGPHGFDGPGGPASSAPARRPVFDAIAEELGIPVERLHRQLMSGKSMRQIAQGERQDAGRRQGRGEGGDRDPSSTRRSRRARSPRSRRTRSASTCRRCCNTSVRGPRFHARPGVRPATGRRLRSHRDRAMPRDGRPRLPVLACSALCPDPGTVHGN